MQSEDNLVRTAFAAYIWPLRCCPARQELYSRGLIDPYGSCPGFSRPSGAPIVLLLGDGSLTPRVTSHRFAKGDQPLESCLFDQTSYRNDNSFAQEVGRTILDESDAIVIIPREPLPIDETYTAQVVANGETYTWSFQTRKGPD